MLTVDLRTKTLTAASRDGGLALYLGVAGALHLGLALLATQPQALPPPPPPAMEVSLVTTTPPSRAPEPVVEPVPASGAPYLPETVEPAPPAPAADLAPAAGPAPTPATSPDPVTAPQPAARRDAPVLPNHPMAKSKRSERVAVRPAAPPQPVQPLPATRAAEAPPQPIQRTVTTPPAAPAAAEASFEERLLAAVQEAARRDYPAAARMMGTTGQAAVSFQYRDGSVHVIGLVQSSGSPVLDRAALAAVQSAHYPPPPSALSGQTLTKLVHVRFDLSSS